MRSHLAHVSSLPVFFFWVLFLFLFVFRWTFYCPGCRVSNSRCFRPPTKASRLDLTNRVLLKGETPDYCFRGAADISKKSALPFKRGCSSGKWMRMSINETPVQLSYQSGVPELLLDKDLELGSSSTLTCRRLQQSTYYIHSCEQKDDVSCARCRVAFLKYVLYDVYQVNSFICFMSTQCVRSQGICLGLCAVYEIPSFDIRRARVLR